MNPATHSEWSNETDVDDRDGDCIYSIDLFYRAIDQEHRLQELLCNLPKALEECPLIGKWIYALSFMNFPSALQSRLTELSSMFAGILTVSVPVNEVRFQDSKGRHIILKGEEKMKADLADCVTSRLFLLLSNCATHRPSLQTLSEYIASNDIFSRGIAITNTIGALNSKSIWDANSNCAHNILTLILPILSSQGSTFAKLRASLCNLDKECQESENLLVSFRYRFQSSLKKVSGSELVEELDSPLQHYLRDNEELRYLFETKSSLEKSNATLSCKFGDLREELKVSFACLRSLLLLTSRILECRVDQLQCSTQNGQESNYVSQLSSLLQMDVFREVARIEQFLCNKQYFSCITARMLSASACRLCGQLQSEQLPMVLDAFYSLLERNWEANTDSAVVANSTLCFWGFRENAIGLRFLLELPFIPEDFRREENVANICDTTRYRGDAWIHLFRQCYTKVTGTNVSRVRQEVLDTDCFLETTAAALVHNFDGQLSQILRDGNILHKHAKKICTSANTLALYINTQVDAMGLSCEVEWNDLPPHCFSVSSESRRHVCVEYLLRLIIESDSLSFAVSCLHKVHDGNMLYMACLKVIDEICTNMSGNDNLHYIQSLGPGAIASIGIARCLQEGSVPSRLSPTLTSTEGLLATSAQLESCDHLYNTVRIDVYRIVEKLSRLLLINPCDSRLLIPFGPDGICFFSEGLRYLAAVATIDTTLIRYLLSLINNYILFKSLMSSLCYVGILVVLRSTWQDILGEFLAFVLPVSDKYEQERHARYSFMSPFLSMLELSVVRFKQCETSPSEFLSYKELSPLANSWKAVISSGMDLLVVISSCDTCCETLLTQELSPYGSNNLCDHLINCLVVSDSPSSALLQSVCHVCTNLLSFERRTSRFVRSVQLTSDVPNQFRAKFSQGGSRVECLCKLLCHLCKVIMDNDTEWKHVASVLKSNDQGLNRSSTEGGNRFPVDSSETIPIVFLEGCSIPVTTISKLPNCFCVAGRWSALKYANIELKCINTTITLLETLILVCDGRVELQTLLSRCQPDIFVHLPALLFRISEGSFSGSHFSFIMKSFYYRRVLFSCTFRCTTSQFHELDVSVKLALVVIRAVRCFTGHSANAKLMAIKGKSIESMMALLDSNTDFESEISNILGNEIAFTLEYLTSRNSTAWNLLTRIAGIDGLLRLCLVQRPIIQVQALTTITSAYLSTSLASLPDVQGSSQLSSYATAVLGANGQRIILKLLQCDHVEVKYSTLRLLHTMLTSNSMVRRKFLREGSLMNIMKATCLLLKEVDPSVVRGVCDILLIQGAEDRSALRRLLDLKLILSDYSSSLSSFKTVREMLMWISNGINEGGNCKQTGIIDNSERAIAARSAANVLAAGTLSQDDIDLPNLSAVLSNSGIFPNHHV